jgi:hypothetical protein
MVSENYALYLHATRNGILAGKSFCAKRTNVIESFPPEKATQVCQTEKLPPENVYRFAF